MSQAEQIYQDWIEALPVQQQLELVAKITQRLTHLLQENTTLASRPYSIMELHGLGAKQWADIDAQSYVDALRNEWN